MSQDKKYTLAEHFALNMRALKLYSTLRKSSLLANTVSDLLASLAPFANIFFSARILTELAGNQDARALFTWVLWTIGLNLLLSLLKSAALRWAKYCDSALDNCADKTYADKLVAMDDCDAEDPAVLQQADAIRQHQHGMGFGLKRVLWHYNEIVSRLAQVSISAVFAFSLFSTRVPPSSPYAYLDSPIASAIVAAVLCASGLLVPYLNHLGNKVWAKASGDNNKVNRICGYYFTQMLNYTEKAKDIRIYRQNSIINKGANLDGLMGSFRRYAKYSAQRVTAGSAVSNIASGLMYIFVAWKSYAGAFGVGDIVLYIGTIAQFSGGFSALLSEGSQLMSNTAFLDKLFRFLDIPSKKYRGTLSVEKRDDNDYQIEFKNVSFRYPGAKEYTLKNISLKLGIGQKIAVVGQNGSGKTTMIKLLCRLYDPDEGVITLNGIDIQKYDYGEYMAIFAVVFQDFQLLPFTLAQNVAASTDVDEARAVRCLEKAGFSKRLKTLPHELHTWLYKNFEKDGVDMSGGEAQKIALARALYKDAPIIVLDEPTAALDPIAEYEIYAKFNEIVGQKTAVYISHRLSSCRFCDTILVFDKGRLAQTGTHEQLVSAPGKYGELWRAQAQYYTN